MKLVLSSAGFTTEEIVKKCEELVGKNRSKINVAVINEGYAVEHDDNLRWVLWDLNNVEKNFGGKLELVNLLALDLETVKERLMQHDLIFTVGGNQDYLMSILNKSGFSKLLPELLETKVYVGSSAGSMVIAKRLSAQAYLDIYGERSNFGVEKFLELVNFTIMPHLDSKFFPNRRETLQEAARDHKGAIYGIRDDTAIIVDENKIYTIGSEPVVINS